MYYLFSSEGAFIGTCDFEPNLEDLASRGEQAVSSEKNFTNPHLIDGKIVEKGVQPSAYHHWHNGAWVISDENRQAQFEQLKTDLIRKISDKTDRLKSQILVGYPQAEIDSFYRQEREARAWVADHSQPTPMLSAIAENRGVPLAILAEKVIEKADQIAVIVGGIIGQRQAFEDRILAAKNPAELTACEQEIEQWQLPNP